MYTKKNALLLSLICSLLLVCSCKDKERDLFGLSIDASRMAGTPSEIFSIQHIKMFQASNDFITELLPNLYVDTNVTSFAVAPFYMLSALGLDTNFTSYFESYSKYYNLSPYSHKSLKTSFDNFLSAVKNIDSTIVIHNTLVKETDSVFVLNQSMNITLNYTNNINKYDDSIFKDINNEERKENFLNLCGEYSILQSNEETVCSIPIGNDNFTLMLIRPEKLSIKEYLNKFDLKHYLNIVNSLENRRVNISFPLISIKVDSLYIPMPQIPNSDTNGVFPTKLFLNQDFQIENIPLNESSAQTVLQTNDSEPIIYNSPFLFVLKGKNSNLIMYLGYYL